VQQADGSVKTVSTREEVEQAAAAELNPRFRLSAMAPIFQSQLFEHVGPLGKKPAVQQILNGTLVWPDGTDHWTKAIMLEACRVSQLMTPDEISALVMHKDFQAYWLTAREATASSYSNLHFGIYMAFAKSDKLSKLQVAKLTLAAKLGATLDRWHKALTVLLDKTLGCNLIHKLRAICLVETDYNWLRKLIFAKRMMNNAIAKGIVPAE
jgi:hypothetical protein